MTILDYILGGVDQRTYFYLLTGVKNLHSLHIRYTLTTMHYSKYYKFPVLSHFVL